MKIAYRTQPYTDYGIEEAFNHLANLGYDGVELCLEHPDTTVKKLTDDKIAEVKNLLDEENNLGLSSVSLHCNFVDDDECFSELKKAIPIAVKFGSELLVISTGKISESKEEQKSVLRTRISELLDLCDENEVILALEPEPDFIVGSTEDMLELIEDVESERLKCNLDIGHSYITDSSVTESIELLGENIVHVHIEDIKDKKHYHLIPGEEDMDLKAIIEALLSIGFDNYLTIDLFNFDPKDAAEPSLMYLRNLEQVIQ